MDELLKQECLVFTPITGSFDTEALAAWIGGLGFSFRDEAEPAMFVVSPDAESRDLFQQRRRADPESDFPYMLLVELDPDQITVWPSPLEDLEPLQRQLVERLLAARPCRIESEYGKDLTPLAA
jgi:hypothetical protein